MNAQKRELRVGHRIDEIATQMVCRWLQGKILSAKRHNLGVERLTAHGRHTVAMQTGACHDPLRSHVSGCAADDNAVRLLRHPRDSGVGQHLADLVHDVIIEQVANLLGVDPEELDT